MKLVVQEMALDEIDFVIDYFHKATPEYLEMLGVDPTRLPSLSTWRDNNAKDFASEPRRDSRRLQHERGWSLWEHKGTGFRRS